MATISETVMGIVTAPTWDQRVARIRQIPARYGTDLHNQIYAVIARQLYVPLLSPEYAYIPIREFFELPHFEAAYAKAIEATAGFTRVSVTDLTAAIHAEPSVLLPLRVITGLLKDEFAGSTKIVGESLGLQPLSSGKIDSMERSGMATSEPQTRMAAETLDRIMNGMLYREPPGNWKVKQQKPDTEHGWESVRQFAARGVPYSVFLHQRHYGGRSAKCSTPPRRCAVPSSKTQ